MTLTELIRRFRTLSNDRVAPYFWSDADVTDWLNDAQRQACIRGRLLREDDLDAVCLIPLVLAKKTYVLHPAVYEIINIRMIRGTDRPLDRDIVSSEWLDGKLSDWRNQVGDSRFVIQNDTTIRVVGEPIVGDALKLECYRLPIEVLEDGDDEPEIHSAHHEHLIQWALHKAFSIPDADSFDANRSDQAEESFTRYFGRLPDADMRRVTRHDEVQHNELILP